MLKLTLRNLLARKVRLVMSGLAIVLGVAFLSGVLVFSNGLSSTFDSIIYSSTPDGVVRPEQTSSFDPGGATTTQTISPGVIDELALRSRGLGSVWTTMHLAKEREVAELLGIPETVTQAALFPVAQFALLVHPLSRNYQKVWFH